MMVPHLLLLLLLAVGAAVPVVDYSGARYFDAPNGNHMFVWAFRSRAAAPLGVLLWSAGGPGCSSLMALVAERNGPFFVDPHSGAPVPNPASWLQSFHLLYVDHPIGAGLSWGPAVIATEDDDAQMVASVVSQWYANTTWAKGQPFWLAGESYAGKYAPFMVNRLRQRGIVTRGVAMGNALVAPAIQVQCFAAYAAALGLVDAAQRAALEHAQALTQQLIAHEQWQSANDAYNNVTVLALTAGGWFDPAFIPRYGFPDMSAATAWLGSATVRAALKVPAALPPWTPCNDTVAAQFAAREMRDVSALYAQLLESGTPVLLFNGNLDFTVSIECVERWLDALQWSGAKEWRLSSRTIWRSDPQDPFAVVGYVRQTPSKLLTLVVVPNAGHQVIGDQPAVALSMIQIWARNATFPQGSSFPPHQRQRR